MPTFTTGIIDGLLLCAVVALANLGPSLDLATFAAVALLAGTTTREGRKPCNDIK